MLPHLDTRKNNGRPVAGLAVLPIRPAIPGFRRSVRGENSPDLGVRIHFPVRQVRQRYEEHSQKNSHYALQHISQHSPPPSSSCICWTKLFRQLENFNSGYLLCVRTNRFVFLPTRSRFKIPAAITAGVRFVRHAKPPFAKCCAMLFPRSPRPNRRLAGGSGEKITHQTGFSKHP